MYAEKGAMHIFFTRQAIFPLAHGVLGYLGQGLSDLSNLDQISLLGKIQAKLMPGYKFFLYVHFRVAQYA